MHITSVGRARDAEVVLNIEFEYASPEYATQALDRAVKEARATLDAIFDHTSKES